jgi:hypothetical protein
MSSNLGQDTNSPDLGTLLSESFQTNSRTLPVLWRHIYFRQHSIQFIIYRSAYLSAVCKPSLDTEGVAEQKIENFSLKMEAVMSSEN